MAIKLRTFDFAPNSAADDASVYSALNKDLSGIIPNRGNELNYTVVGTNLILQSGILFIKGRSIEIVNTEIIPLIYPSTVSQIICEIDLNQENESIGEPGDPDYEVINNQVTFKQVTGVLIQEDILNGGKIFQLPLINYTNATTHSKVMDTYNILKNNRFITSTEINLLNTLNDQYTILYNKAILQDSKIQEATAKLQFQSTNSINVVKNDANGYGEFNVSISRKTFLVTITVKHKVIVGKKRYGEDFKIGNLNTLYTPLITSIPLEVRFGVSVGSVYVKMNGSTPELWYRVGGSTGTTANFTETVEYIATLTYCCA